jgi:hypothetical protein
MLPRLLIELPRLPSEVMSSWLRQKFAKLVKKLAFPALSDEGFNAAHASVLSEPKSF